MRHSVLALIAFLLLHTSAFAAYPYDSVCQIMVKARSGFYNGGSASLVAVSDKQALLLTCGHVCVTSGSEVRILWPGTGEEMVGRVLKVGKGLDIAICICPRPKGLRPIPVAYPNVITSGVITNAGFPGVTGTLEWQQGKLLGINYSDIYYSCRPIPGMSGGCTFDQYGNQIGVIVAYGRDRGFSTSGKGMANFLADYMINHKVKQWSTGKVQEKEKLPPLPAESMIRAPKDYAEFQKILKEDYGVKQEPVAEGSGGAELKGAAMLEPAQKAGRQHIKKSRGFHRRIFRRRR